MPPDLPPAYDPKLAEPEIWKLWETGRHFHAHADPDRKRFPKGPFTIVIPPPNVTGALHMGHALNNTLQDILVRRRRMQGFNALWMPGTDHAGIATQSVVEKQLKQAEGKTRHDLGRDELVKRIWAWKEQYGSRIIEQLKRMGCSCDWERTRFTLDEMCAKAVRRTFFDLFKKGLIYRGKRLVNWDPALQTAVADDELDDREVQGNFYYIKYPLKSLSPLGKGQGEGSPGDANPSPQPSPQGGEGAEFITVATTRPETMLGDTAVAINPKDPRAAALRGRTAILPLLNREIPIVEDDYVVLPDPNSTDGKAKMATGFLKVTPAHDPNDYAIGLRHKLEMINIFNPDATVNENGGPYKGLDRYAARKQVCADLDALVLLEKTVPYVHSVPHSDRSGAQIEPYLSDQWFVKMDDPNNGEPPASSGGETSNRAAVSPGADAPGSPIGESAPSATGGLSASAERSGASHPGATAGLSGGGDTPVAARPKVAAGAAPGLAQIAIDAVTAGKVKFHPERYGKTYLDWLGAKRDWCISRQLWWGHRIPVWTRRIPASAEFRLVWNTQEPLKAMLEWPVKFPNAVPYSAEAIAFLKSLEEAGTTLLPIIGDPWTTGPTTGTALRKDFGGRLAAHRRYVPDTNEWEIYIAVPPNCDADEARLSERGFSQDPDVLDTWFSSALWPHSTLGWPEPTPELKTWYPGDVLVTSRDIITLWVARMVMTGLSNCGDVPFRDVVIHAKIMDGFGETMSKSRGNGVDPVDLINKYGADGMRFTLASMATETQDVRLPVGYLCPHCEAITPQDKEHQKPHVKKLRCGGCKNEFAIPKPLSEPAAGLPLAVMVSDKFDYGRNFCNKLWNAARFIMMNLEDATHAHVKRTELCLEDRWITNRLASVCIQTNNSLEQFQFAEAARTLYGFVWDEFCAWYVEAIKHRLRDKTDGTRVVAQRTAAFVLDACLRLLHPIIPFVTEYIWRELRQVMPIRDQFGLYTKPPWTGESGPLIRATWPEIETACTYDESNEVVAVVQGVASVIKQMMSTYAGTGQYRVKLSACGIRAQAVLAQIGSIESLANCTIVAAVEAGRSWTDRTEFRIERALDEAEADAAAVGDFDFLRDVIRAVRNIRNKFKIAPGKPIDAYVRLPAARAHLMVDHAELVIRLAGLSSLSAGPAVEKPAGAAGEVLGDTQVWVPLEGLVDFAAERKKLTADREKAAGALAGVEAKLSNEGFVSKAKPDVIEKEKARRDELRGKVEAIDRSLTELS